ncbi:unnamed protein product [Chrysoparadoxa australica]
MSNGEPAHDLGGDEDKAEETHYNEVRECFIQYLSYVAPELDRLSRHISKLPQEQQDRLPKGLLSKKMGSLQQAMQLNQVFLDAVISVQDQYSPFPLPPEDKDALRRPAVKRHNMNKMRSTLHQVARDWSVEGEQERRQCYTPLLEELERLLPVTDDNRNKLRVLVPGSGLGRLVLEVAQRGYAAQGNEFSYFMLFVSNFILNAMQAQEEMAICPYIDNSCNNMKASDMTREVRVPDTLPGDIMKAAAAKLPAGETPDFTMTAGEWMEVYSDQEDEWDCIVTCFFIDTAPVIMEYIATIKKILKPGGVWINLGPLLYHWVDDAEGANDERFTRSVELSWEEMRHVIGTYGFEIIKEEMKECCYTCNQVNRISSSFIRLHTVPRSLLLGIANMTFFSFQTAFDDEDSVSLCAILCYK